MASNDPYQALPQLAQFSAEQVINPLFSLLCSTDSLLRWRAITAMGVLVAQEAESNPDWARIVMRRLMWSLNDESGGIGWGAPEAMAEILARHQGLCSEYAHILISYIRPDGNFLEHELLQCGAIWALGRLAQVRPGRLQKAIPYLLPYLEARDSTARGLAAWTLGSLRAREARSPLQGLLADNARIQLYVNDRLNTCYISDLAREALMTLDEPLAG